jgi:TonB family protein
MQNIAAAIAIAYAIAFVHWLGHRAFANWTKASGSFTGPEPSKDERSGRTLFGAITLCLILIIVCIGFFPVALGMRSATLLLGFTLQRQMWDFPHGQLFLWTVLVLFLWVELGHLMRLRSVWSRVRFVLLLIGLPLALASLARCLLDAFHPSLAASAGDVGRMARFVCLAVVPFFVPSLHARLFAPLATQLCARAGSRWREAVENIGNVLLFVAAIGAAAWFNAAPLTPSYEKTEWPAVKGNPMPGPSGERHSCAGYYPPLSLRLGEEGTTVLSYRVSTTGSVKDVAIVHSSGSDRLDLASALCVTHWTYKPVSQGGQNVEFPWKAAINWRLTQ